MDHLILHVIVVLSRASSMKQSDPYNTEGAILKQTIMKGIANQLAKATVSVINQC